MDSPEVEIIKAVSETSQCTDYDYWGPYDYEEEAHEEEIQEGFEDEEEDENVEEEPEEVDVFGDFVTQFQEKIDKKLAASAEAKKEHLRQLIGVEKKKEVSEETLITPEAETDLSEELSSESSVHPCLRRIDISDSRLKLSNMYTMFPIPDDPGLVPAFWNIFERPPAYKEDGVQKFIDLTRKHRIRPIRALKDMLLTDKVDLQYYGIEPRVIPPLCEALLNNTSVEMINLSNNWLPAGAGDHLNKLLVNNNLVQTLLLAGCRIGAEGVAKLRDGISASETLTTLDLSDCNIRAAGLAALANAIRYNRSLETLLLNNNHLDESCSESLQNLLSYSEKLKQLGLSWNSLYTAETWRSLVKGLGKNTALNELDLSWNALGQECVPYLSQILLRSQTIKKLDLNGNRFSEVDATSIARALSKNKVLEEVYLGNNPLKPAGALALVGAVHPPKSPDHSLRVLDLTNVCANKEILSILEQPKLTAVESGKPPVELKVKLGHIIGNYEIVGPDARKLLLKRANYEAMKPKKKRLRKNFGHFVLSLTSNPISKAKFKEQVKAFRLKLSESLIDAIMNTFSGPKNTVDQGALQLYYLEQYPDTKPPPAKPVKTSRKPKPGIKGKKRK